MGSLTLTHTAPWRSPVRLDRDVWRVLVLVSSGLAGSEWKLAWGANQWSEKPEGLQGKGRKMWVSGIAINPKQCVINCLFFRKTVIASLCFSQKAQLREPSDRGISGLGPRHSINICWFNLLMILSPRLCLYYSLCLKTGYFTLGSSQYISRV